MPKRIQANYRNLARMYGVKQTAEKMRMDGHSLKVALYVLGKKA